MIDRKRIHEDIKKIQRIKTWHLIVLLVLASFLSATFLRLNNIGMIERRTAVVDADEAADSDIIKNRLYDLQRYVASHMNTDLGQGVYLEYSYQRDAEATYKTVETDSEIYQLAQQYCMPKFSHWSQAYVQCVANKLSEYPQLKTPELPEMSNYLHDYISPIWSPDFAGWSLVSCAILIVLILSRIIGYFILRAILKYKHPTI